MSLVRFAAILCACAIIAHAQRLFATRDFYRPDPFGAVVKCDRAGAKFEKSLVLKAARASYVSFHLIAANVNGDYELRMAMPLPADLYREWYHLDTVDNSYYPDALVPIRGSYHGRVPDRDNHVPSQTAQAFWADIWIPASTNPGRYHGAAELVVHGRRFGVPVEIDVTAAVVPDQDAVTLDNNSYGTSWLSEQYPKTLASLNEDGSGEDKLFDLIHAYHRIFYEHRGTFHQLGYGHAGKVGPEFAPVLTGTGRSKHVANWTLFDRHYGPLLNGSAFTNTRRGARPIPFAYLPVNPEWPASFLWWGEPGYEAEFVNVMRDMELHFRENGWTSTRFEVFFNHKKRYKGFPWDGDEIRFDRDNEYLRAYHRMLVKAVPADSPVQFLMRADTSWDMERQFSELQGVVRMWVAGAGTLSWYPGAIEKLKERGDIVWTYGGTPPVHDTAAKIALDPLRTWIAGAQGFVRWLTVAPGPDPWFHFGGGAETLVYSGERFGYAEPLASIRLKLQRNCLQDLALLEKAAHGSETDRVKSEVVRLFNGTSLDDWHNQRPPLADQPVLTWTNANMDDALRPFEARFSKMDPASWLRVRQFALERAR